MYLNIINNKRRFYTLCLLLAFAGISFYSCQGDDNEVKSSPFDSSKPVEVSDFTPKSGGAGQRLVIYGTNFGTDPSIVSVFIGGIKAVVIGVNGESIYCLVPKKAIGGEIEVRVGEVDKEVIGIADSKFDYQRKMIVSTVIGYRNDRGDEGWKDGKFFSANQNEMACGFWDASMLKFDPMDPNHLWMVFDGNNGLYDINFADSTVTKKRADFDRARSVDFTLDGKYMIIAEDRGGENDRATYALSRDQDWQDRIVLTTYKQCNGASVHPVNGELYFNSFEKGQFFRYDLNKAFTPPTPSVKDFETLFVVQDPGWEYKIFIHPSGNYAYIVIVNKHYILRIDYNWEKKRFNQPYLVCGRLGSAGYQDGVGSSVRLDTPYQGVFVKNPEYAGKPDEYDFYFTERHNHDIRKLTPQGSVTTFAGRGSSSINPNPWGYVDGDLRQEARFDQPTGLAYNVTEGAFYIGDSSNHRIRKIALEEK